MNVNRIINIALEQKIKEKSNDQIIIHSSLPNFITKNFYQYHAPHYFQILYKLYSEHTIDLVF